MIYRKLGETGIEVSRLGFGAMRPPMLEGKEWDSDLFIRCMHRAFDLGVTYVDTAYVYGGGKSEEHVGRAVKGRRDDITISTKIPVGWGKEFVTPEEWRGKLDESLARLGTHIDICFLHDMRPDRFDGPHFDGIVERMKEAVEKGDVRFPAVSGHAPVKDMKRYIDTGVFKVILLQYNMLNLDYGECLAYAKEKGLGTVIMGPVSGGLLAEPSEILKDMSPVPVESTAELALRFALSNPDVDSALSGMNSIDMVEENCLVATREETLSAAERATLIERIKERVDLDQKVCTQCGYCMPCEHGLDIQAIFGAFTRSKVWGMTARAERQYNGLVKKEKTKRASECTDCGECEEKCPQKIPIREQMKEASAMFDNGEAGAA